MGGCGGNRADVQRGVELRSDFSVDVAVSAQKKRIEEARGGERRGGSARAFDEEQGLIVEARQRPGSAAYVS